MAQGRQIAALPTRGDSVLDEILGSAPPAKDERTAGAVVAVQTQANLQIDQLPDPIKVDRADNDDLDTDEAQLLSMCDLAVAEYARAEAVALKALLNVQQRKLYRAEFKTFAEYVDNRLTIGRQYAYRQLDRYLVSKVLSPIGDKLIPEWQARELAPVLREAGPAKVKEVWEVACDEASQDAGGESGVVTGVVLKRVRKRFFPPKVPTAPELPRQTTKTPGSRYTEPAAAVVAVVAKDKRDPKVVAKDLAEQLLNMLPPDVLAALKTID